MVGDKNESMNIKNQGKDTLILQLVPNTIRIPRRVSEGLGMKAVKVFKRTQLTFYPVKLTTLLLMFIMSLSFLCGSTVTCCNPDVAVAAVLATKNVSEIESTVISENIF